MIGRVLMFVETIDAEYGTPEVVLPVEGGVPANVVTSRIKGSKGHAPALDIDFQAELIPSSTAGHFHLYLEKGISWRKYRRLLKALGRAGILERGYVRASIRRGYTAVRLPGIRKASVPGDPF